MSEYFVRCVPCGAEIKNGEMAQHIRECEKQVEPRTPFHGKPNEPIIFTEVDSPKV